MGTEEIYIKDGSTYNPDEALKEIKDGAIMLSMASEYLCEEPFMKKIGFRIEQNIEVLASHIEDLKSQFVGKPMREIDLEEDLKGISHIAELLQKVDDGIKHKCVQGELGKELKEKLTTLANRIKALRGSIDGGDLSYTTTDSVLGFLGRFKSAFHSLTTTSGIVLKIFGLIILICLMAFSYLFFTMETEKGLLERVELGKSNIQSIQAAFPVIDEELKQIREKIESIRKKDLNRQDEMEVMDLNLKSFKLSEKREKLQIQVNIQQDAVEENLKKLEEMKHKSFLKRLLRR